MSQFCPQCGTKNLDEAKFCKNCGFNIYEAASQAQQEKNNIDTVQQKLDTATNADQKSEAGLEPEKITQELSDKSNKYSDMVGDPTNPWNGFLLLIGITVVLFITIKACSTSDQEILDGSPSQKPHNLPIHEQTSVIETAPAVQNQDIEYFNKAEALWDGKKGQYKKPEKAIEYLSKAIEINPKNSTYYNDRAVAFDQINKKQKAIKDYTKSVALNSKDGTVYQNRGYTYWDIGEIYKAKSDAKKACNLYQCQLQKDIREWEKNNQSNDEQSDVNQNEIQNTEQPENLTRYTKEQCQYLFSDGSSAYQECIRNSY